MTKEAGTESPTKGGPKAQATKGRYCGSKYPHEGHGWTMYARDVDFWCPGKNRMGRED